MAPFLTSIEKIYLAGSDTSRRAYVFVASAERPLQSRLGTVFGLVELNGLAEPLSEKIFEIVRDLEIEYYLPPFDINEPHERRFEECLQRANRRLGRTIQDSIERVNVERITALVGLISQNKLHLSTIGPAGAFLFHRRRRYDQVIIDIIDQ
nr:hypothetical protein [Candidatus Buchananbacteria bacterium]